MERNLLKRGYPFARGSINFNAMNHRWKDNTCIRCGVTREKKPFKVASNWRCHLVNGVWTDSYDYGIGWAYDGKFVRPDCKKL